MASVVQRAWCFVVGYVLVPLAFYAVDALGHLPVFASSFSRLVLFLNVALVLISLGSFLWIEAQRDRLRLRTPFTTAVGAALGLLHWFPLYMMFGARFLWSSNAAWPSPRLWLVNLLVPVVSLSGATYDGSVLALLASPPLLLLLGARWLRRPRARAA